MLREFGAASSEWYFMGGWMVSCGLLLIGLNFIMNKFGKDVEESHDSNAGDRTDEEPVLHVTPGP